MKSWQRWARRPAAGFGTITFIDPREGPDVARALATDLPGGYRLVVAQDTGGAIKGPVRGDLFWGHGPQAEEGAGVMKARGHYTMLAPRTLSVQTAQRK